MSPSLIVLQPDQLVRKLSCYFVCTVCLCICIHVCMYIKCVQMCVRVFELYTCHFINLQSCTVLNHQFHTKCGRNIKLTDNCTVASRVDSYNCGIVFSNGSLKNGEVFEVHVCTPSVCVYLCIFVRLCIYRNIVYEKFKMLLKY